MLLTVFSLLLATMVVVAQEEPPAPQFLYRGEDRLVLVDGYTGETTELPLEVADEDRFEWSPTGQYLLAQLQTDEIHSDYCINLYDVDEQAWVYDEPLDCAVREVLFSADGTQLIYNYIAETYSVLWLYDIAAEDKQELYRTPGEGHHFVEGTAEFEWSPTEAYLTFYDYYRMAGGPSSTLIVLNMASREYFIIMPKDTYYANYDPIWSPEDHWFIIQLYDEYVISTVYFYTDHQGDVYLFNAATGEQTRLTYTPTIREKKLQWTDDGDIAYTEVLEPQTILRLAEAQQVPVVPDNEIIMPEPIDWGEVNEQSYWDQFDLSPDPAIGMWQTHNAYGGDGGAELWIGDIRTKDRAESFTAPLPEGYQTNNILIGWRPSDYSYPEE